MDDERTTLTDDEILTVSGEEATPVKAVTDADQDDMDTGDADAGDTDTDDADSSDTDDADA